MIGLFSCLIFSTSLVQAQCDCTDYLYLNDVATGGNGFVHKFAITNNPDGTIALDEVFSDAPTNTQPWFPAGAGLPSPHGLGQDINGYLYIGAGSVGRIRRLTCDGTIAPFTGPDGFQINSGGWNFTSYDNVLYVNHYCLPRIEAYDPCDGSLIGYIELSEEVQNSPTCVYQSNPIIDWGFHINDNGTFYVSSGWNDYDVDETKNVYVFTPNLSHFQTNTVFTPLFSQANFPAAVTPFIDVWGISADPAGNIYLALWDYCNATFDGCFETWLLKFDAAGNLLAQNNEGGDPDVVGFSGVRGITYYNGYLLASGLDDCVALIDADDMSYTGIGIAHVPTQVPKALALATECCPTTTPLVFNETVCSPGNGEKVFLQEIFSCGDGPVCEGQWMEIANTSGGTIMFNECDLSITITGSGCATYMLEKTTAATVMAPCDPFLITVNVCTEVPTAVTATNTGTCTNTTPNNDARISLSSVTGDQANYSLGTTYTGPAYDAASNIDVSGGSGTITGLMHNSQYTVRVFNGANDCFVDYPVTTANIACPVGDCVCYDYIYLNDPNLDEVHKFQINAATGGVTEIGNPWGSGLNFPHGIGMDLNGFIYIGELDRSTPNNVVGYNKLTCDGVLVDDTIFDAAISGGGFQPVLHNVVHRGNLMIRTEVTNSRISMWNVCTANLIGYLNLEGNGVNNIATWGLSEGEDGLIYAAGYPALPDGTMIDEGFVYRFPFDESLFASNTTIPELFNFSTGAAFLAHGVDSDAAGNIYVRTWSIIGTGSRVYKFNSSGVQLLVVEDLLNDGQGFFNGFGLTYSAMSDKLYLSDFTEDCIAILNATDLFYQPTISVPGAGGKGIGILTECCPNNNNEMRNIDLCASQGDTIYLADLLPCEGMCASAAPSGGWTQTSGTTVNINSCDLSIILQDDACFTFSGGGSGMVSQCPPYNSTICFTLVRPSAAISSSQGTCSGMTPNDDASISISSVMNADQANYSIGTTYAGPVYDDGSNIDVSVGGGTITGLMHNTQYTVRIFNGANDCFVDFTVTTPTITCVTCPMISNPSPPQLVCEGETISMLSINTDASSSNQIEFVYFTNQQTGNAMYAGGTSLGIVSPTAGSASISNVGFPATGTYYVYAILNPAPSDMNCRPFQEIPIEVIPCDFTIRDPICDLPPCHFISDDIYLGSGVDSDMDPDDEDQMLDDGAIFPNNIRRNVQIRIPVTIYNNTGETAYLSAWIDWDGNGDFTDSGEQIASETYPYVAPNIGSFQVSLPTIVPNNALQDTAISVRFRLSSDPSIRFSPCGVVVCAADGEVEDYLIQVECPEEVCLPIGITIIRN